MNPGSLISEPVLVTHHHMLPPVLQTDIAWNWEAGWGRLWFLYQNGN